MNEEEEVEEKAAISREVWIPVDSITLPGELSVPGRAEGLVLFAHGSGSSRHSPRNQYVAQVIREAGVGTLLLDLLTREEERIDLQTRHLRFDIAPAGATVGWRDEMGKETKGDRPSAHRLFRRKHWRGRGSDRGGGDRREIGAVVSRGGRPDMAGEALPRVVSPTLLIVGGSDDGDHSIERRSARKASAA